MLLPVDPNDPMGFFQASFKITAFWHVVHANEERAYPSIEIDLISDSGAVALALVVMSGDEQSAEWKFEPDQARFLLPTTKALGERILAECFLDSVRA